MIPHRTLLRHCAPSLAILVLSTSGCIGRSLVDTEDQAGQPTQCSRPDTEACARLLEPPPAPEISPNAFEPSTDQRNCAAVEQVWRFEDGERLTGFAAECVHLRLELAPGAVVVLEGAVFRNATVDVVGSAHARLTLRSPTGTGVFMRTEGQVSVRFQDPELGDLRVVLGPESPGNAMLIDGGTVEACFVRGGVTAELHVDSTALLGGAIDVGRFTVEATELSSMQIVVGELLAVDSRFDRCLLSPWTGGLYTTGLTDTALVGCAELLLSGCTVFGGYVHGCSHSPLRLLTSTLSGYRTPDTDDLLPLIGPFVLSEGTISNAIIGGEGFAHGASITHGTIGTSVLCDPAFIDVDDADLSCSVCVPTSPFEVCLPLMSSLTRTDSDCAPFEPPACHVPHRLPVKEVPELRDTAGADAPELDADAGVGG